jgi:hypothetical protein
LNSNVASYAQPFHRSSLVANGNVEIKVKLVVGFFIATCFVEAHWSRFEIQIEISASSSAMTTA